MVGSVSKSSEDEYGAIFAKYLSDPSNFFVISSDFCHWGKRFNYTYYDSKDGEIYQSIEKLDRLGMQAIETKDPNAFYSYQKNYKNTICGRHPIGVFLQVYNNRACSYQALKHSGLNVDIKFVHYAQSSRCRSPSDSSVSYAVAVASPSE